MGYHVIALNLNKGYSQGDIVANVGNSREGRGIADFYAIMIVSS